MFTLLVHLGYLAYNQDTKEVCIPNKEVIDSFVQSVKNSSWGKTTTALINHQNSYQYKSVKLHMFLLMSNNY